MLLQMEKRKKAMKLHGLISHSEQKAARDSKKEEEKIN